MTDEEFVEELKNLSNTAEQMFTLCSFHRATQGEGSVESYAMEYIQAFAMRLKYLLGVKDGTIQLSDEENEQN